MICWNLWFVFIIFFASIWNRSLSDLTADTCVRNRWRDDIPSLRCPCVWCILSGMHFYLNFPHMTQIWWIGPFFFLFFFWKVRKKWCCCAFSGWFPFSEKAPNSYNPPIFCLNLFRSDSIAQFIVDSFWNLAHPSCTPNCYHEQSLSSRDETSCP